MAAVTEHFCGAKISPQAGFTPAEEVKSQGVPADACICGARRDPCIVTRAVVVIEAAAALAACEVLERGPWR